jgi:hypothetical protein
MAASKGTATITPFRNATEGCTERTASRARPKAPRPGAAERAPTPVGDLERQGAARRRPLATQSETI